MIVAPHLSDLKIKLMEKVKNMLEADVSHETFGLTEEEAESIKRLEYHKFTLSRIVNMFYHIGFKVDFTIE